MEKQRRGKDAALQQIPLAVRRAKSGAVLVQSAVDLARDKGATWEEIGEVLGVTKQAAQMRFGKGR